MFLFYFYLTFLRRLNSKPCEDEIAKGEKRGMEGKERDTVMGEAARETGTREISRE